MKEKKTRIPWWKVPKHILLDVATSGLGDPTKMKWYMTKKESGVIYGS